MDHHLTVWTIGHSTHPLEEFVALLGEHRITQLADIRTVPGSRHNPQFGQSALQHSLPDHGIAYRHLKGLGGLRHASKDSVNTGWRNASFRGYADHMQTPDFARAVDELLDWARQAPTAVMCSEAVPWRCHRSMVADALLVRGVHVVDIMGPGKTSEQKLTSFARVDGTTITYPAEPGAELP